MLRRSLSFFVLLSSCAFEPAGHPYLVDAPQRAIDAPAAEPIANPIIPPPAECACTVVGPETYPMALPFSANTTYVAGTSQVKADDLNDLQAQLVANVGNLITALGGAAPDTLTDMISHGTFTPVIVIANQANAVYTVQTGAYLRIGPWVLARIDVAYTNNDDTINASNLTILAPYACEATNSYNGVIDYANSDFGTANANITTAGLRISSALGGIQVIGKATTMASSDILIAYGDSNARRVTGSIWYKTDGTFNY
jgi:hypothetical protein